LVDIVRELVSDGLVLAMQAEWMPFESVWTQSQNSTTSAIKNITEVDIEATGRGSFDSLKV